MPGTAQPSAARSSASPRASSRCPSSDGCSRSTLHAAGSYGDVVSRSSIPTVTDGAAAATASSSAALRARIRAVSALRITAGNRNTRVWSWNRTSRTVAPARPSRSRASAQSRRISSGSKSERRVSFIPAQRTTTSGRAAAAAGTCSCRVAAIRAPVRAWLSRRTGSGRSGSVTASRRSGPKPRHPPPGRGSPSPTAVESPSTARCRTGRPGPGGVAPVRAGAGRAGTCREAGSATGEDAIVGRTTLTITRVRTAAVCTR